MRYLGELGYDILATNWRAGRSGELDIVARMPPARQGQSVLVFVEVKTRGSRRYGLPVESLTPKKQAQLLTLAEHYLLAHPGHDGDDIRFDVISIEFDGKSAAPEIVHLENAFHS